MQKSTSAASVAGPAEDASRWVGPALLMGVQLCFGIFHAVSKIALESFTPRALAAWRLFIGSLVLVPLALLVHKKSFWPARADLVRLQICALFGIALNQLLYLEGMQRAPAGTGGLVMALIPIFTVIIAILWRQEQFSLRRVFGIALALAASTPLFAERIEPEVSFGTLLLATNALSYSIYLVISRPLTRRMPPLVVIAWVFLLSVWTVPLFAWNEDLWPSVWSDRSALAFAYVLIFPTTLAYVLNILALSRVPSSTVALYILLQPLIAAAAGLYLFGEPWSDRLILAQVGVMSGILLISWRRKGWG